MATVPEKYRMTFADLCERLSQAGFRIVQLQQRKYQEEPQLRPQMRLEIVVLNDHDLGLREEGDCGPPCWGEDVFYRLAGKVEIFRV